jgi:HPr kinase/phosphorylase
LAIVATDPISMISSGETRRETLQETIHATALVTGETGILIRGPSGAGKSNLAFALIDMAGRNGAFARLVGDDRIILAAHHGRLIARGHPAVPGMIELRGQGILACPFEPAAILHLAVDFVPAQAAARYPEPAEAKIELCGVKLRRLALPMGRSSYDCALLVLASLSRAEAI